MATLNSWTMQTMNFDETTVWLFMVIFILELFFETLWRIIGYLFLRHYVAKDLSFMKYTWIPIVYYMTI